MSNRTSHTQWPFLYIELFIIIINDSFVNHIAIDMTKIVCLDNKLPDQDINSSAIRNITLNLNASSIEDNTVQHIPQYPTIRIDRSTKDQKLTETTKDHSLSDTSLALTSGMSFICSFTADALQQHIKSVLL